MDEVIRIYTSSKKQPLQEAQAIINETTYPEIGQSWVNNEIKETIYKESKRFPKFEKEIGIKHSEASFPKSKWKYFFDVTTWKQIIDNKNKKEHELMEKYPAFNIIYNWVIVLLVIGLFASFVIWGIDIRTDRIAETFAATALADYQAELDAQAEVKRLAEEEARNSQEAVMDRQSDMLAKLAFGIRNFEEKYGYGEKDFRNYFRCVMNRVKNSGYGVDLETVINQKDQWVGYYETNPVQLKYKNWALDFLKDYANETVEPIGSDYVYTIFTDHGLYLAKEFNSKSPYQWWTE